MKRNIVPATLPEIAEAHNTAMLLLACLVSGRKGQTARITRAQAERLAAGLNTVVHWVMTDDDIVVSLQPSDPELRSLVSYVEGPDR